jgi:alginate O-acetyltransferase complex protein AlgI
MPYFASDIADFWRRWHISLSTWLRDYLYVPLGGNRHGVWATYRNLLLTMLLGGLWHGASWTFVAWGAYHGGLLAVQRFIKDRWPAVSLQGAAWKPLAIAFTFLLTCVGWVFFRAQTFGDAGVILTHLCWPTPGKSFAEAQTVMGIACLLAVFLGHLAGTFLPMKRIERWLPAPLLGAGMAVFLVIAQVLLPEDGKAFIYFQF